MRGLVELLVWNHLGVERLVLWGMDGVVVLELLPLHVATVDSSLSVHYIEILLV